jgi:hypothetical protein
MTKVRVVEASVVSGLRRVKTLPGLETHAGRSADAGLGSAVESYVTVSIRIPICQP